MEAEMLGQILKELREIRQDLRWLKEREELKQRAAQETIEDAAARLSGGNVTKHRAKAMHALTEKAKNEK